MSNHHLRVRLEPRLYPSSLPLPENHVALPVTATNPLPVRREADLTGVPGDGVASEPLVPSLTEIVRAVDEDLVVQRLGSKVFLCNKQNRTILQKRCHQKLTEGLPRTYCWDEWSLRALSACMAQQYI